MIGFNLPIFDKKAKISSLFTLGALIITEKDGMQGLGHLLGGGSFSEANGVSFDGSVIVGSSDTASGEEAFYRTEPVSNQT